MTDIPEHHHHRKHHPEHSDSQLRIVQHFHPTDYRAADEAKQIRQSASTSLHRLDITNLEQEKRTLIDRQASLRDRLMAAQALASHHQDRISYTDHEGGKHDLEIQRSRIDGRLRVFDGGRIILEDCGRNSFTDHLQPAHHIAGLEYKRHDFTGVGRYRQPSGGRQVFSPHVDPHFFHITQNPDGSRTVDFNGCEVDTDGNGYHPEDPCWQPHTSLRLANGESLNTDLDNFVVLSPSLARALGVKLGDRGYLVDKDTGRAVPVVFGDVGPEGKHSAEASVHSLKQIGHPDVDGNNGVGGHWQVVVVPHSGDGTGNIARNADAIKASLDGITRSG